MRVLQSAGHQPFGIDVKASPFTDDVGSIVDRSFVKRSVSHAQAVIHAATLHKPHVATHSRQAFVDTNVTGTLNLLEEASSAGVEAFVYTSTTSVFGRAARPAADAPAAWIAEDVVPDPRNIYGITKLTAEHLCHLFHRTRALPCVVLRTSRFFPEADDDKATRESYHDTNAKANEMLYRRADIEDVASAHLLALERAASLGFARYVISATTPFTRGDLHELHTNAPAVVKRRVPHYEAVYASLGWTMFPAIDRVYVNDRARAELGWTPRYDFARVIELLEGGSPARSPLAQAVGSKGYHEETFTDGPYPVE
jgi:UDP-glucose 4-epimerase